MIEPFTVTWDAFTPRAGYVTMRQSLIKTANKREWLNMVYGGKHYWKSVWSHGFQLTDIFLLP